MNLFASVKDLFASVFVWYPLSSTTVITHSVLILLMLFFVRAPVTQAHYRLKFFFYTIFTIFTIVLAYLIDLNGIAITSTIRTFSSEYSQYSSKRPHEPRNMEEERSRSKFVTHGFHTSSHIETTYSVPELELVSKLFSLNVTQSYSHLHEEDTNHEFYWNENETKPFEEGQKVISRLTNAQNIAWTHSHATFLESIQMAYNLTYQPTQPPVTKFYEELPIYFHITDNIPTFITRPKFKPITHVIKTNSYVETTYSVPELELVSKLFSLNVTQSYSHLHEEDTNHEFYWNENETKPFEEGQKVISRLTNAQNIAWTHSHATFLESIQMAYNLTYQPSQNPRPKFYQPLFDFVAEYRNLTVLEPNNSMWGDVKNFDFSYFRPKAQL